MKKQLVILITGANSGIGKAAAIHLQKQGHRVFATGRNPQALADLQKETGLETIQLDVTKAASIARAKSEVDQLTRGYGVDVLVNNAGYGTPGPTELITDEDLRAQYEVNVFGLMAVTRAFVPQMRARGAGRIINVSSLGGRLTLPFLGAYNSTKYAVESLSDALRVEMRPFGVRVSLIEPGVIETGFTDRSMMEAQKYKHADSPYQPILQRMDEIRKMSDSTAVGPACISKAIERAATDMFPRARYVAPFRAQLMIAFLRALPTAWADTMLRLTFGLTKRRFRNVIASGRAVPQLPAAQ